MALEKSVGKKVFLVENKNVFSFSENGNKILSHISISKTNINNNKLY